MGGRLSKKNNYMKKKTVSNNNINSDVNICNYPPLTTEPVTCLTKKSNEVGYCGFSNGSISVINFAKSRIKITVKGHDKEVSRMKYLTKSCQLCTVSRDKSIKLWSQFDEDRINEEMRCDLAISNAHELIISGLDISNDETSVVTGSRDNMIKLWDLPKFTVKAECKLSRNLITFVKYSNASNFIAASGEDKIIRIFDSNTLEVIMEFPKIRYIQTCCDVSFDDKYIISSSNGFNGNGCEITFWDLRMRKVLFELVGHQSTVNYCIFVQNDWFNMPDSNGYRFASCASDNSLILWNTNDTQNSQILSNHHVPGSGVMTSILPLENQRLAVGTYNTGVVVMEYNNVQRSLYHVASI